MTKPYDNKRKFKLLFLSGGSLVGQNVLFSLSSRRDAVHLVALNSIADEPSLYEYDEVFKVPSLVEESEQFSARFNELLPLIKPDLIIPCRDEDVAFLSGLSENRPDLHGRLLCGSEEVAKAMLDKGLSWTFSVTHGLPFAPSINSNADNEEIDKFLALHGLPVIAKPKSGFASRGVYLVYKTEQLEKLRNRDDYIFQKYLTDGENVWNYLTNIENEGVPLFHTFEEIKISIQASIGPDGTIGALFATLHKMRYGKSVTVSVCDDIEVLEYGEKWAGIFSSAGWRGPLNIQCQRDQDGNMYIYEYNGRFTGATSARTALGYDEVGIILEMWLKSQFSLTGIQPGNKTVLRAPVSRVVDLNTVKILLDNGYWSRQS